MSDRTFTTLPSNRNDLEYERFGLDPNGRVGVRTVGGTTTQTGDDLGDVITIALGNILSQLEKINQALEAVLFHQRIMTEVDEEPEFLGG